MDKSTKVLGDDVVTTLETPADSTQSSKNILDILSNDSIIGIFRQFTSLEDLVNMANVCQRFRECAMSLKFMFRSVTIERTPNLYSGKNVVSARAAPLFFKTFGHLVESVDWRLAGNDKRNQKLFERLAHFCGETLKKLRITDYNPCFKKRNQFPVLEQLILLNAKPKHFCLDSPLKHIEIQNFRTIDAKDLDDQQPWFVRKFPHLENVCFNTTKITDETLNDFLYLNRQLRALEADSEFLTPMVLKSVGFYSRNIERLQITSAAFYKYDNSKLHDELLHLSELRKLSEFGVPGRLSLEILLKMFAENNIPIRYLNVDSFATGKVATFPTIETLNRLECICRSDNDVNCLVNLVKNQPALQTLQIMKIGSKMTDESQEKLRKLGRNITRFLLISC